jgi:hypothetical protein
MASCCDSASSAFCILFIYIHLCARTCNDECSFLNLQPVVGNGNRSAHVNAAVTQRDCLCLNRVAAFFSYGSLASLLSGLASGGLFRRVQQLALNEFVNQTRVQLDAMRRERDVARQEGISARPECEKALAKAQEWQGLCGELERVGKQQLSELHHELCRTKADLAEKSEKLGKATEELVRKRKLATARKAVGNALRKKQRDTGKQEGSKTFLRVEISRFARKLDGHEGEDAAELGKRRRKARVVDPSRRAQNARNAKVRDALNGALEKIRNAVGTGGDSEEDEKRALEAVAKALSVKSGKKRVTAHPELLVPERINKKLREEGEKAVVEWMHNPARWCKMMDLGEISFRRADKLSVAFPKGAKPSNKAIIREKKVLNHVMQEINPITATPGENWHGFHLETAIRLTIPLWVDELQKAKAEMPINWETRKGKLSVSDGWF